MEGNGNLAELALRVAGNKQNVEALAQYQSPILQFLGLMPASRGVSPPHLRPNWRVWGSSRPGGYRSGAALAALRLVGHWQARRAGCKPPGSAPDCLFPTRRFSSLRKPDKPRGRVSRSGLQKVNRAA